MANPVWYIASPTDEDAAAHAAALPPTERELLTSANTLTKQWQKQQYTALKTRLMDPAPINAEEMRHVLLTIMRLMSITDE